VKIDDDDNDAVSRLKKKGNDVSINIKVPVARPAMQGLKVHVGTVKVLVQTNVPNIIFFML